MKLVSLNIPSLAKVKDPVPIVTDMRWVYVRQLTNFCLEFIGCGVGTT